MSNVDAPYFCPFAMHMLFPRTKNSINWGLCYEGVAVSFVLNYLANSLGISFKYTIFVLQKNLKFSIDSTRKCQFNLWKTANRNILWRFVWCCKSNERWRSFFFLFIIPTMYTQTKGNAQRSISRNQHLKCVCKFACEAKLSVSCVGCYIIHVRYMRLCIT